MKIQRKLLLSYLLIVGLFIAIGAVVVMGNTRMVDLQNQVTHNVDINNNAYIYQQGMDAKQFASFVYSQGNA
jgi:CHASE3 domain sensor protein